MTWTPLLDGARRESALAVVREIGSVLADPPPCAVLDFEADERARVTNLSLAMGRAGIALSHGYLALADPDGSAYATHAKRLISDAARALASVGMPPSLYGGFCGIAWALLQLRRWNLVSVSDDSFAVIDKALVQYLGVERPDPESPELIHGVGGYVMYALARMPNDDALRIVERALDLWETTAQVSPEGMTWFVPASHLSSTTLERAPNGCYNLGIAHGNPGVIALLAEIHRLGVDPPRTRRLLEETVRWLLAQEIDGGNFPSLIGPGVNPKPARVSWCYGSPGIPLVLLRAARALDREDWHDTALRLAIRAAETPVESTGVEDPPFCHGAAGLVHQFNRLHQETGMPLFADAARTWFDELLKYRVDGDGVAGFSARVRPTLTRYAEPGFLYGAAGIAAVLGAAISDAEPSWDAMFLISDAGTA